MSHPKLVVVLATTRILISLLLEQAAFYGVLGKARKLNLQLVFVGEIPVNTPDDGHPTTG